MEDAKEKMIPAMLSPDGGRVVVLDQTMLPEREVWLELSEEQEMYEAISELKVRGAPAIGIFAAAAMAALAAKYEKLDKEAFVSAMESHHRRLGSSRPTAINLQWALNRQMRIIDPSGASKAAGEAGKRSPFAIEYSVAEICRRLREEAETILKEDIAMCRSIAEHGLSLLHDGCGILTHCNAGALATSMYGTALGPLYLAKELGINIRVFADETRPLLQGARLTAYELSRSGIDVTLICDNMASVVMKNGWVDACFVGCDRIAANGDTANKIGTSSIAILAKYYGIPFYVLGPSSSIDINCPDGAHIPIEQRPSDEIKEKWYLRPMAPQDVKCYNPAFDVTDNSLISGIVTEKGILRPPFEENIRKLFCL